MTCSGHRGYKGRIANFAGIIADRVLRCGEILGFGEGHPLSRMIYFWQTSEVAMLAETRYEHIVLSDDKIPTISGTNMKVVELVSAHLAYGWSAEELHFQFPYLAMGQIHSALAYYWDHREEFEKEIERQLTEMDAYRRSVGESNFVKRMKAKGLI